MRWEQTEFIIQVEEEENMYVWEEQCKTAIFYWQIFLHEFGFSPFAFTFAGAPTIF